MHHPNNLKPKHVYSLLGKWRNGEDAIAIGTIKNRLATLRWLSDKVSNSGFIRSTNDAYDLPNRSYVGPDKSLDFDSGKLANIPDDRVRLSAELQKHFGLRREEAIKFTVSFADRGDHIKLKSSWCKGGRERTIPVFTQEQRNLLNSIKTAVGNSSLIPSHLKYVQQMRIFEKQMHAVGLGRTHGARHMYAQRRYEELTKEVQTRITGYELGGFKCPAQGGLKPGEMLDSDKSIDREVRQIISRELGHERIQVTAQYLGG